MDLAHAETILADADSLPIMSGVLAKMLALTEDPDASSHEFEQLVRQDMVLSSRVLRMANSCYFGGNGITSIQRALLQLGNVQLRAICLTMAFQNALAARQLNKQFNGSRFWDHSLAVACSSRIVAECQEVCEGDEAFLAGMLHDVGKLVLALYFHKEYSLVVEAMTAQRIPHIEAEKQKLETTHEDLGLLAANRWEFPAALHESISRHHSLYQGGWQPGALTLCVHVGDAMCYRLGLGHTRTLPENKEPSARALDDLGISELKAERIIGAIGKEFDRHKRQMAA